jgi:hypothetical protein
METLSINFLKIELRLERWMLVIIQPHAKSVGLNKDALGTAV